MEEKEKEGKGEWGRWKGEGKERGGGKMRELLL